ncbi:GNAT family N-acetyltransferase [Streptomyces sp. HUAS MG47]|uniref:GNAT family N-acetyltransferase n=1 Tax=Streptomyces solicamelliae TaxID=3231716 RepID=UPI003877DD29
MKAALTTADKPIEWTDVNPRDAAMAEDIGPLIRTLRPGLSREAFHAFAEEAHRQGLVFTAAYDADGRCLGVATHRLLATSRGRMLCVDDLVTAENARSSGVGARLLGHLADRARRAGCTAVELDTGTANHGAQRFYHARRLRITALHFALDLTDDLTDPDSLH